MVFRQVKSGALDPDKGRALGSLLRGMVQTMVAQKEYDAAELEEFVLKMKAELEKRLAAMGGDPPRLP